MKLISLFLNLFYGGILLTIKIFIMNEISIEQAKETHDALREILIKYGCEEYSKKDLKKYVGYEIVSLYENNKAGVPSLVFIRGEKEYYKPLN